MQTINNLLELQKQFTNIKKDPKSIYFFAFYKDQIILYKNSGEFVSRFENLTGVKNIELDSFTIETIALISKQLKIDDFSFEFEIEYFEATEDKKEKYVNCFNVSFSEKKYSFTALEIQYSLESFDELDFRYFEYLGKITKKEILQFVNISKLVKIDDFRNFTKQVFISDNKFYITDSFQLIFDHCSLQNCYLEYSCLKKLTKFDYVEIYKNENIIYYKTDALILQSKIFQDEYKFVENIKNIIESTKIRNSKFIIDFTEIYNLKNSKFDFIFLNLLDNTFTLSENYDLNKYSNLYTKSFKVKKIEVENKFTEYIIMFKFKTLINLLNNIENKTNIEFQTNESKSDYSLNNYIIMESHRNNHNIEIIKNLKLNKNENITSQDQTTEIKEIKPKIKTQVKTMDLKKEKIVKAPVSKYKQNIENEVKNEIVVYRPVTENDPTEVEFEVINEVKNEVKKLAAPKNLQSKKEIKNELSQTTVGPDFEFIDFIYMHCANELENLNYYNTDYRNNKLYLENFEFGFRKLENQIEVVELDYELNTNFLYFQTKKDLLKFVRSKIELDYNLTH